MNKKKQNIILIVLIILITVIPLIFMKGAEFGGSDDQAEGVIEKVDPDYKPWAAPLWEPPSGEIESLLFGLQAAIGSGIIFYIIGYNKGKRKKEEK